jgi:phosphatidylglycerophosphatase A
LELRRPRLILGLATWGGVGYLPIAPGTWGSLAALPLWWLLAQAGPLGYGLGVGLLLVVAVWAAGPAHARFGRDDHGAIVIDEVAGQLIALAGLPLTWPTALAGFFVFRVMDVLKPWPVRYFCAGTSGGLEVVADDVAAAIMARLLLEAGWLVMGLSWLA